ncbi:hypothetical protein D1007_11502 [Hordeum vulgare]|nr:hypothetical protein D1007_11502 [Hordeum vulgare]
MATAAVLILLAALLPALAAATDSRLPASDHGLALTLNHTCGIVLPVAVGTYNMGTYAPGSAYEATLRHLAATIPGKADAESGGYSYYREHCSNSDYGEESRRCFYGNIAGESPNRIAAYSGCSCHRDVKSPDCGACIALAFQEAQRLCPFQRMAKAVVDGGACKCEAYFHDYDIMEDFQHGDPNSDPRWNAPDQVMSVVAEDEENNTRMGWACCILETTIMEVFANLGWMTNRRICA